MGKTKQKLARCDANLKTSIFLDETLSRLKVWYTDVFPSQARLDPNVMPAWRIVVFGNEEQTGFGYAEIHDWRCPIDPCKCNSSKIQLPRNLAWPDFSPL